MTEINGAEIEAVDVITFGSPCQDLSVAGKRAGLKHSANGDDETTRSGLFMEAVRIIKEMRRATHGEFPKVICWENVPGAFSSNKGEDFRTVLEELVKIVEPEAPPIPSPGKAGWPYADCIVGDGWSLAWRVFDAQYWPSTPQRRRRIYLVLDLTGGRAEKVLFERLGLRGHPEKGGTTWQGASEDPQGRLGADDSESGIIGGATHLVLDDQGGQQINVRTDGKAPTIRAEMHGNVPCVMQAAGFKAGQSKAGNIGWQAECAATLSAQSSGTEPTICVFDKEVYNSGANASGGHYIAEGGPAPTLRGTGHAPGLCENYIVRRLTPTECARLQGFPDRWGDIPLKDSLTDEEYSFWLSVRNTHAAINGRSTKEYTRDQILKWYNKLHSDSSEYKMWGNGIALPNALYVMQGIAEVLNE